MKTFILLAIVVGLSSCNSNTAYQKELAQIDSLQTVVEGLKLKTAAIDKDSFIETQKEVDEIYYFIEDNFTDSTNRKFWVEDGNDLREMKRAFQKYVEGEQKMTEELALAETQLLTLEESIKAHKIEPEKLTGYIQDETEAVNAVGFLVSKLSAKAEKGLSYWEEKGAHFTAIVDSLKNAQ